MTTKSKVIQMPPLGQTFTFEKIKLTLIFYWNILWRCLLFVVPMALCVYLGQLYLDPTHHDMFVWMCNLFTLALAPLVAYAHYNVIVCKEFKDYDKNLVKEPFSKFWCWGFWSAFLKFSGFLIINYFIILVVTMGIDFLMNAHSAENLIDSFNSVNEDNFLAIFLVFMNILNKFLGYHIFLHKGLWGFVLVAKKPSKIKK